MRWIAAAATGTMLCSPCPAQTSPSDFTTGHRYDSLRRLTGTISPDPDGTGDLKFAAVRNSYDAGGNLIKVEKGELASWQSQLVAPASWSGFSIFTTTDIVYDPYARKVKEVISGSTVQTVTQYSYDPLGRLECVAVRMNPAEFGALPSACTLSTPGIHGPDRITRNVYYAAGQLHKVQKAYGSLLQQDYATYTYSPNRRQTSVVDANGNKASMTYDGHDRQSTWVFPSKTAAGQTNPADYEEYGYDANGNRTSLRKRDETTIAYTFDALNRLSVKVVPTSASGAPGYSVYTGYDLRGLQTYARFGSASGAGVTSVYDGFGDRTSETSDLDGTVRVFTSTFDANGNRLSLAGNPALRNYFQFYTYDGLDRVKTLGGSATTTTWFGYNAAGLRSTLGQGASASAAATAYGYNGAGVLISLSHDLAGSGADQSLGFEYNGASQIVTRASSNDAYVSNSAYNVSRSYSVNGLNQYTAAGPATFSYDANGNLVSDGSTSFLYDGENRLVGASGAKTATFAYDPLGRLRQLSGPSGTTRFFYDGDTLRSEYDGSNIWLRSYMHGAGADEPLTWHEMMASGVAERRFLKADHQGSIIAAADPNGNAIAINGYDAWGIPNAGNIGRFGYTGQTWIPELGMWYYKARIYSPTLGRFLQTDPVGYKDQVNLYAYVGNDPVNRYDSKGAWSAKAHRRIFELALRGSNVTAAQQNWIEHVSMHQDLGPNSQRMDAHFLRNPGEDRRAAREATRAYIDREVQIGARYHNRGDEHRALAAFARAAHALQDSYSPVHNEGGYPAEYHDLPGPALSDAVLQNHSPTDWYGGEGTDNMTRETRDAMAKGTREILERIRNCNSQREREQQC